MACRLPLGLLLGLALASCATEPLPLDTVQERWLPPLQPGVHDREEVRATLGEPTETFAGERCWVYWLLIDPARGEIGLEELGRRRPRAFSAQETAGSLRVLETDAPRFFPNLLLGRARELYLTREVDPQGVLSSQHVVEVLP